MNYIHLDQCIDQLPLTDKEFHFIDPFEIVRSTKTKKDLISSLNETVKNLILFRTVTQESTVYPRFDLKDYFYKIKPNPCINILPDNSLSLDTETLFDSRSLELLDQSKKFQNVYVFWSGGIDSTLILSSILKNWKDTRNLKVVLNKFSIEENKNFYDKFIDKKIDIVDTNLFYNYQEKFNHNNLYVSGDLGDPLITFDNYDKFDKRFPDILNNSWKKHVDKILDYFTTNLNNKSALFTFHKIIESCCKSNISLETLHDFFWWINFNWGYDTDLIYIFWQYQNLDKYINFEQFQRKNIFYWYNSLECQNWAMSLIGTDQRAKDNICKYAFKKYIYNFDKDLEYFKYKKKEPSTPKNLQIYNNNQILAIDVDWNVYYRRYKK